MLVGAAYSSPYTTRTNPNPHPHPNLNQISAAYSSSYTKDPIAEALGVKTVPTNPNPT